MEKRILIVVGSTGGHYFPGITLGEKIREMDPGVCVFFAGEYKIKNLEIWKSRRLCFLPVPVLKRPRRTVFFPLMFFQAIFVFFRNLSFIKRVQPDLIVCFGSYASVIIGLSARLTGKVVITHEQNVVPGLANKILNFVGIPVAISFNETRKFLKKTIHTGLPLRREFFSEPDNPQDYGLLRNKRTIIIIGGSQGASFINDLVIKSVEKLKERYQFIHITGRFDYERVLNFYKEMGVNGIVKDFSLELPAFMNFATIGIARAGAGTIAELSYKGIPSILIPYRFSGAHQYHNARWAENHGCIMLEEKDATPQKLIDGLMVLEQEIEKRKKLFQSARIADVDGKFAGYCLKMIGEK